jgi:hypothetical protein
MQTKVNYERASTICHGMVRNGMTSTDAAPLALALEFAATHPEFAVRFGYFSQDILNQTLDAMAAAVPA